MRTTVLALLVALFPAAASPDVVRAQTPADTAAVVQAVSDFHMALASADSTRVLGLLAPGARILEGAGVETVDEYRAHHLPADMAFASAVTRQRGPVTVRFHGDVAWAISTSRATGTYRDREIDSRGAELMVLTRHDGGWRIEAIHWSSR